MLINSKSLRCLVLSLSLSLLMTGVAEAAKVFIEKPIAQRASDAEPLNFESISLEIVDSLDARLIAEYDTRILVEVPDNQLESFEERAQVLGYGTYARPEFDRIRINGYDFASDGGRPDLPPGLEIERYEGEIGLYLIQMVGPPKQEWVSDLRDSADIVRYFSENTFLVRACPGALDGFLSHPEIQYIGVHQPAFKVQRSLLHAEGVIKTIIQVDRGQDLGGFETAMSRLLDRPYVLPGGGGENLQATVGLEVITALARRPEVLWIESYGAPAPSDERHAMVMEGQISGPRPSPAAPSVSHSAWLSSKGFCVQAMGQQPGECINYSTKVANFDTGLDLNSCWANNYDTQTGTCLNWSSTHHVDFDSRESSFFCIPRTGTTFCSDYLVGNLICKGSSSPWIDFNDDYVLYGEPLYHGTPTSSLIGGQGSWVSGQDGLGYFEGSGMAPRVNLVTAMVFRPPLAPNWGTEEYRCLMSMVSGAGATFANNSWNQKKGIWGAPQDTTWYSTFSQTMDRLVRDTDYVAVPDSFEDPMTIVFSAGNLREVIHNQNALVQAPGNAKNVISVGASEGWQGDFEDDEVRGCCSQYAGCHSCEEDGGDDVGNIFGLSLRSTEDGRVKPDLVAPGSRLRVAKSAHSGSTTDHQCFGGTSGAAPLVTGSAVLVDAWLRDVSNDTWQPSPAMLKAMLVAHADDLHGGKDWLPEVAYQTGFETLDHSPSAPQGWGRVNLDSLIPIGGGGPTDRKMYREDHETSGVERRFAGFLTTWSDNLEVVDPNDDVIIVMAYTDAAGTLGAATAAVNNLNLVVVDGSGLASFRYYGNEFETSGYSERFPTFFSRVPDSLNNVEVIRVPPGEIVNDDFIVEVYAATFGGVGVPGLDGGAFNQDFALYILNARDAGGGQ